MQIFLETEVGQRGRHLQVENCCIDRDVSPELEALADSNRNSILVSAQCFTELVA